MKSFSQFLVEEKNTHLSHIEDGIFISGVDGAVKSLRFLQGIRDTLSGTSKQKSSITLKIDGAPSLIIGIDPEDKKFFVAKKGVFNKNPKVYKSIKEINDSDLGSELKNKFTIAFEELSKIGLKSGALQGDFLYVKEDLKTEVINGEKYVTFHPNTLVYAIPSSDDLAHKILKSRIGIVWHTSYSGDSLSTLKVAYNSVDVSKLKTPSTVWQIDANHYDLAGTITLTDSETKEVTTYLSSAGKVLSGISSKIVKDIVSNADLSIMVLAYNNTKIKENEEIKNINTHIDGLIEYVKQKFQKEMDAKKQNKTKLALQEKLKEYLKLLDRNTLYQMYQFHNEILGAKEYLIQKLNKINSLNTFVKTKNGYSVTGHEGFVVSDHIGKSAIKLVSRLEFSRNNFSADVIKGWQR